MGVTITWAISCGLESSKLQLQLFQAANNWPLFPPALLLTPSYKEGRALATPHKKHPLSTELPRRLILGNPYPYTRILMRYRGVWLRPFVPRASGKSSSRKLKEPKRIREAEGFTPRLR